LSNTSTYFNLFISNRRYRETKKTIKAYERKLIDKAFKKFKIDFIAMGRKLITDKFFLYNLKDLSLKDNLIKQYKYCLK